MSTENEFKKRIADKLTERKFEFSESDWEAVVPLLEQSRSRRKYFWLLLLLPLGFFFVLLIEWDKNTSKPTDTVTSILDKTENNSTGKTKEDANLSTANDLAIKETKPMSYPKGLSVDTAFEDSGIKKEGPNVWNKSVIVDKQPNGRLRTKMKGNNNKEEAELSPIHYYGQTNFKRKHQLGLHGNNQSALEDQDTDGDTVMQDTKAVQTKSEAEAADYLPMCQVTLFDNSFNTGGLVLEPDTLSFLKNVDTRGPAIFLLGVGGTYLPGWTYGGVKDARGFNPDLWLAYERTVKTRIKVSLGIGYSFVNHLKRDQKTASIKKYNFGEELLVTDVKPLSLHYLSIPLRIAYCCNRYSEIGAGISLNILSGVRAQETRYEVRNGVSFNYQQDKTWGYDQGISPFDVQFHLFYKRKVYNNWYFLTEGYIGSKDVKANTFFNAAERTELNKGFRIGVIYRLKIKV